jgi:hypothetical protein
VFGSICLNLFPPHCCLGVLDHVAKVEVLLRGIRREMRNGLGRKLVKSPQLWLRPVDYLKVSSFNKTAPPELKNKADEG